jgi:amidase
MNPTNADRRVRIVEATIAELAGALDRGDVTSVELVAHCLNRIARYDRSGIRLNAVPVLNPGVFADAQAADDRRARGERRGPLDGIPYTAKDSYQAAGLTVAAGSPAFEHLVASRDAYSIGRLRDAGAVLIGLTNMPPMANGGMQRGVYGRAESPYNADYLTAAFASGSSNGSGTATAGSFAVFGLGEETWSSGRAPASNNALVAYTPSRGVISVRGNWPLVPTMDVVVPHTRSVDDLLALLDVIVSDDPETRGDFWRVQPWVEVPPASTVRPASYPSLRDSHALRGKRLGIPRMYVNADSAATKPIETRPSVIELWEQARGDLEALGVEVVDVDFPVVSNYERDRPGARSMVDRGLVPEEFAEREIWDLSIWSWDDFLAANADPTLHRLADVDGTLIFPPPTGALRDRYDQDDDIDLADYVDRARLGVTPLAEIPTLAAGLRGLEETRRVDLEQWMDELGLDAVVFPAVADVGPADADVNPASAELAWRNGTWVANGNLVPRHLGIPTVTVPMGTMADIGMPVGLTFAGRAYDDNELLRYAWAFEQSAARRSVPPRTPALPDEVDGLFAGPRVAPAGGLARSPSVEVSEVDDGSVVRLQIRVEVESVADGCELALFVNGERVEAGREGFTFTAVVDVPRREHEVRHSEWREPYGSLVVAVVRTPDGRMSGAFAVSSGPV